MSEPKQLELTINEPSTSRKTIYVAPPTDIVDRYAFDVCHAYKKKFKQENIDTEFVQGFKAFVRAVVKAQTNLKNKGKKL